LKVCYLYLFAYLAISLWTASDYRIRGSDENVYLNAAEIMRNSGDYSIPKYYWGEQRVNKPIGLYWLIIAGQWVFGENILGARIISIIGLFITIFLSYKIVKLLFPDQRHPELVILVLSSMPFFFHMGRVVMPEMILVSFITLSHYFLFKTAITKKVSLKNSLLFFGSMGIGFMIKGPGAIVFPMLTAIVYFSTTKQWKLLRFIVDHRGWMLLLLITMPWYLFLLNEFGSDSLVEMFNREIVQRIVY